MSGTVRFTKNHLFVLVILFCLVAALLSVLSTTALSAGAEDTYTEVKQLNIAHITDTHYYPLRYCHNGAEGDFQTEMLADSKILIENSAVIMATLEGIRLKGDEIDVLFVTGDISKDGERASHVDMANALRRLQNDIREGDAGAGIAANPDFQVFVTFGNHDLYNPSTYSYGGDGEKKAVANVSRKDVEKIYFGLGYPDITLQQANSYFAGDLVAQNLLATLPYEAEDTSLVYSTNYDGYTYEYLYNPELSDYAEGQLSYIVKDDVGGYAYLCMEEEDSNPVDGHVLTGTVTEEIKAFYTEQTEGLEDYNKILLLHHNLVPQFPMESSLLSGFVVNDWLTAADFFADLGVRYSYSGHMHSNSVESHISFNNNQITDTETAGAVSYGGGTRYIELSVGTYGNYDAEKVTMDFALTTEVDFTYILDNNYITSDYLTANNLNQYMNLENKKCLDFSEYAKQRIYLNIVTNMAGKFLDPEYLDELIAMVEEIIPESVSVFNLTPIKAAAGQIIENLVSEIELKVLSDYTYSGSDPRFTGGQNKLFAYLNELIDRVLTYEIAPGHTFIDTFFETYLAHIYGNPYETLSDLPDYVQMGISQLEDGTIIRDLINILLDENTGLYRIVKGLLTEEFDLSTGIAAGTVSSINSLVKLALGIPDFTIARIKLDELVGPALDLLNFDAIDLEGQSLMEFADHAIDSYVTESLMTGMGDIAANILLSFCIDKSADVEYGNDSVTLLRPDPNDPLRAEFSYISIPRVDNPTVDNGKLPGKATVTFGADPATSKNFSWLTDKRVTSTEIRYSLTEDMANPTTIEGTTEIYAYTIPAIDAGVFCTTLISEIGRHSVEVTGLTPDTTYYYQIGSASMSYWSPVYKMKTAPAIDSAPFTALLFADPQSYTERSYSEIFAMLDNTGSVFPNGYDFIISVGDNVDNSANTDHYKYFLNTDPGFFLNSSFVYAAGNHESKTFEIDEDESIYYTSSDAVITEPYNSALLYYNISMPAQDTTDGAGVYYSFDYSGVHFTVLNTNDINGENKLGAAQMGWLVTDLQSTDKQYKVVIMHKSLYSLGAHSFDADVVAMRSQLTPIFADNGVNLVLAGHDHTYATTYYLDRDGKPVENDLLGTTEVGGDGVLYVTLGTVGNKYYDWVENENVPYYYGAELHDTTLSNPVFAKLYFDGEKLYYEPYQYNLETGEITLLLPVNELAIGWKVLIVIGGGAALGGIGLLLHSFKKRRLLALVAGK